MIEIFCKNTNEYFEVEEGTSLLEVSKMIGKLCTYPTLGALVNNQLEELAFKLYSPKTIQFIDISNTMGFRMYTSSLSFLLYKAIRDLHPKCTLKVEHSSTVGYYCEIDSCPENMERETFLTGIKQRMHELVEENIPFISKSMLTERALELFDEEKEGDVINLIKGRKKLYTKVNYIGNTVSIFYSKHIPSTGYLKVFDLTPYNGGDGFLLHFPDQEKPLELSKGKPSTKMFKIYREHKKWLNILNVPYVYNLNAEIEKGHTNTVIQVSEALHEKKILKIVDKIVQKGNTVKALLIAGPSSSGKTTTCRRIGVQLAVAGYQPKEISLDNYFVDREHTPKTEFGEYDFECLEALDIEFFNKNLLSLFKGEEILIPKFDFLTGKRFFDGETLKMEENSILIIEGIHALNPKLSEKIDDSLKYKIFVSPLTQISIDRHNIIHSTDSRLIRRIVRDFNFRGYSAYDTLKRWGSVTHGERKHIFPYQENADIIFNSSLMYEIGLLKKQVEPLLQMVPPNTQEYAMARRLQAFLSIFYPISEKTIPPTSIMREFLGESSFVY